MTKPGSPSYASAEHGTRRAILILGAGFVAFVLGALVTAGLVRRLAPFLEAQQSDFAVALISSGLQGLWGWLFLPLVGWLAGRFLDVRPAQFTVPAALCGLTFETLLNLAMFGSEVLFADRVELVLRLAWFSLGLGLTMLTVSRGGHAFDASQARARAAATPKAAEYEAFSKTHQPPPSTSPSTSSSTSSERDSGTNS